MPTQIAALKPGAAQALVDQAVVARNEAEGFASTAVAASQQPLPDRAAFLAADIHASVTRASFFAGGNTYAVVRTAGGRIAQTNGDTWEPDGDVYPEHFGAVADGVADDSTALELAYQSRRPVKLNPGTYRQTRTVTAFHPLKVEGANSGATILLYEDMGGYDGSNGIDLQIDIPSSGGSALLGSQTSFKNVTVKITGQNGASWFKAPRGTANLWTRVKPSYDFQHIYFTGDNAGDAAFFELTTTAWECCIDLGESVNVNISHIHGGGNYDFRAEPTANAVRSTVVRLGGAEAGPGGVLTPHLSHWWVQHFGRAIDIGWRCIRGQFHELAIHLGWEGMYSPNPRTGPNWGIDELEMSACNINVQKCAVFMRGPTGGMVFQNVDMTRARNGFDHGTPWVGMDVKDATRLTIQGGRAYNDAPTGGYTGGCIGYLLENIVSLLAGGMLIRGIGETQFTTGIKMVNPARGAINALAVSGTGSLVDLIEFAGTPLATGSAVGITLTGIPDTTSVITGQRIRFSDDCDRTLITDLNEPGASVGSADVISAAGFEDYFPGNANWRRINFAAGSGPYTYDIRMQDAGFKRGEDVEFTIGITSANATVRFLDHIGDVQAVITSATPTEFFHVRGRYLSNGFFRIVSSGKNL